MQADEIKAKIFGRVVWLAMAIMVSSRLWLGGEVSHKRDKQLIRRLAERIHRIALCRPLLLAVDGLPGYVKSFQAVFRSKIPRWGEKGRCKLVSWPNIAIVQVIKRRSADALEIERRIAQGYPQMIDRLREATQSTLGVMNTAYIERLKCSKCHCRHGHCQSDVGGLQKRGYGWWKSGVNPPRLTVVLPVAILE